MSERPHRWRWSWRCGAESRRTDRRTLRPAAALQAQTWPKLPAATQRLVNFARRRRVYARAQSEVTEVFAEAGSLAVLPCQRDTRFPHSPAIIWTKVNQGTVWRKQKSGLLYRGARWSQKGSQRIHCPHPQFEKGNYSLHIDNVREDDGGLYSCRVQYERRAVECQVILRIITVSVTPLSPILGKNVSLSCNVTPWPNDATLQWTFVPKTGITASVHATSNVVTEKATERLTGNWTCVVGYKGQEGRASRAVTVKGIIQPSKDNTKVYAAVGSAATLPCVFSSGLTTFTTVWEKLKPGSLFKPVLAPLPASFSPPSASSQTPLDKSASLREVEFNDAGSYRCSATIQEERLTRNMQLVVAKIDSSTPSNKNGAVTLTCQLTDESEVTDFEWVHVVSDLNGVRSSESIQKGKTLTISKESERGEWECRFSGKEGILGNITYNVQVMSGQSGQKSSGVSRNTVLIIGLSFLLAVLLLVLAQMYKNHQRRKRIFQYPALETIVHATSNEREERERKRERK